jgi:hypothetical protein
MTKTIKGEKGMKGMKVTIATLLLIMGFAVSAKAGYVGDSDRTWRMVQYQTKSEEYSWSVAPKLIVFFPNSSDPGLHNFSPGIGVGIDGRYNFIEYFALSGELDYIGLSSYSESGITAHFSNFAIKVDALCTIPLNNVIPFFGLGLVYNFPSVSASANGYSSSESGNGIGLELVGGIDFAITNNGAFTAGISIPISQNATFNGGSTNVDVGVYEIMAGYRFLF